MSDSEWIYGRRPVWEALHAGKRTLHKLWVLNGVRDPFMEELIAKARERGVPLQWSDRRHLDQMVKTDLPGGRAHHQGVVAQVSATAFQELDDFLTELGPQAPALVLALDEIQDPQNVGAILRTAGFFGVTAVLFPKWRSAPVSETALRVSSGAAEHLVFLRVSNLVHGLERFKECGFQILGADMEGRPVSSHRPSPREVLVLGSEGQGLRRLVREHCDHLVGIPVPAKVGSLNVATAGAIILYELTKPHQGGSTS